VTCSAPRLRPLPAAGRGLRQTYDFPHRMIFNR